ncbi:hypothetical protein ABFT02_001641 [Vibrio alginolyticus]
MRPKGSRDPLGSERVWGYLGRRLVGNLTTVTSNLNNFFVALLSCDYAHQNADKELAVLQERFARMEQLLAYVRLSFPTNGSDTAILGITKVKQRVSDSHVRLGLATPLLNNQLSMGLWGLYTPAMARAELVEIDHRRLTATGEELASHLTEQLGTAWKTLCQICDDGELQSCQLSEFAAKFELLLGNPHNRTQFVQALIASNQSCNAQSALYCFANQYLTKQMQIGTKPFLDYLVQCDAPLLQTYAMDIMQIEPVLVLNDAVFVWLQGLHDKPIQHIVELLNQGMNCSPITIPDSLVSLPHHSFLMSSVKQLNDGNGEQYLQTLLHHHQEIMKQRNGAPWVESREDKLFVRVVSDAGKLPDADKVFASLSGKFENNYFLESFLLIAQEAIRLEAN